MKAYQVAPDPAALARSGLTTADLKTAIEAANKNDGAGRLEESEQALIVHNIGAIQTLDDLREIVVPLKEGGQARLGDLADVRTDALTRYGAVTKDGHGEAAEGIVLTLKGADANKVVKEVQDEFAELQPELRKGVHVRVFYNRSELIQRVVHTVVEALIEAVLLVVVLLVVFLGDLRASLVVALTLPMAALATVLLMRTTGISANLMSLGGLAIAIGMLVDGGVVIVENAAERLAEDGGKRNRREVVAEAAKEVSAPVFAGVLIIWLVFTPLLSLRGQEGKMFSPVALIIVYALAASLLLSMTFTSALASLVLARNDKARKLRQAWIMRQVTPRYRALLKGALGRPRLVVGIALAGMALAILAYFLVGKSFIPQLDEGTIVMQLTKEPSIDLKRSLDLDTRIQKAILRAVPEVADVVSRTGSDQLGLDPMGLNETDTFIMLKPKSTWRVKKIDWVQDQIRKVMVAYPGTEPTFTQPIAMRTDEMLTGARGAVVIKIFGKDLDTLSRLAVQVRDIAGGVKGASNPLTTASDRLSYLELNTVRSAAGRSGLTINALQDEMRAALEGTEAGLVREVDRRTPILIRGPDSLKDHPEIFPQIEIATPDGGMAHIADVANVSRRDGPVLVEREQAERGAVVQVNAQNRALVAYVKEAQATVKSKVKLSSGYRIVWSGQFESQQRASARLSLAIPVALLLICVVLYLTLNSIRQTVLILLNIPFALVGGMLTLWATGQYLSVPASVGFIALLGIAVLNGLVLVSHYNDLLAEDWPLDRVVREGAERRLRPVLMTANITAFGLAPLLFASGPGSEIQRPARGGGGGRAGHLHAADAPDAAYAVPPLRRRQAQAGGRLMRVLLALMAATSLASAAWAEPRPAVTITPPPALMAALPAEELARAALEDHPDVVAAKARLEGAKAEDEKYRVGDHEIELQAATGPRQVRDETSYPDTIYYEGNGQLTRAFRLPGKARLDRRTGAIGVKAAADEVDDARHQTGLTLAADWFDWIRTSAEAELDRQTVQGSELAVQALRRRVELKDAAPLELDQAVSTLDQARARTAASEGAARQAALALARGFPDLPLPVRPPALPAPADVVRPEGGWHEAIIARSHEIRIAQYKADQQKTIAERKRLDEIPDPTLGVRLSDEYGGREKTAQLVFSIPFGGRYRSAEAASATAVASALQAQATLVQRQISALADEDVAAVDSSLVAWRRPRCADHHRRGGGADEARLRARGEGLERAPLQQRPAL